MNALNTAYQNFRREARIANLTTFSATLAVVLPLLALTASLPTLRLGVTFRQLRPIWIPSVSLLATSSLLILPAIKTNRARNRALDPYMNILKNKVEDFPLKNPKNKAEKKAEEKAFHELLLKDLIKPYEATDFRYFLLTELAKSYPKDSDKREAIEAAREKIIKP